VLHSSSKYILLNFFKFNHFSKYLKVIFNCGNEMNFFGNKKQKNVFLSIKYKFEIKRLATCHYSQNLRNTKELFYSGIWLLGSL